MPTIPEVLDDQAIHGDLTAMNLQSASIPPSRPNLAPKSKTASSQTETSPPDALVKAVHEVTQDEDGSLFVKERTLSDSPVQAEKKNTDKSRRSPTEPQTQNKWSTEQRRALFLIVDAQRPQPEPETQPESGAQPKPEAQPAPVKVCWKTVSAIFNEVFRNALTGIGDKKFEWKGIGKGALQSQYAESKPSTNGVDKEKSRKARWKEAVEPPTMSESDVKGDKAVWTKEKEEKLEAYIVEATKKVHEESTTNASSH